MNTSNDAMANSTSNALPPSAFHPARPTPHRRPSSDSTTSSTATTSPSTRRKPVSYLSTEEIPTHYVVHHQARSGSSNTLSIDTPREEKREVEDTQQSRGEVGPFQPPAYVLEVALPLPTHRDSEFPSPPTITAAGAVNNERRGVRVDRPSTPPPTYIYPPPVSPSFSISTTQPTLPLPTYTLTAETEPSTLPRQLFMLGCFFPPLWALGAIILCVPLKVYEEDFELDFERRMGGVSTGAGDVVVRGVAQEEAEEGVSRVKKRERELLDEKILILRRAEIRWARYCAIGFSAFVGCLIVVIAVVLFVTRR